jgi:hypothetical protein
LQDTQAQFYNTMIQDTNQRFSGQTAILGTLNKSYQSVIDKGSGQQGWTPEQSNAMNSSVIQGTGQQYASTSQALKEQQAAEGGGNSMLPSGVASQQKASLASNAANQVSSGLTQNLLNNYNTGLSNYNNAMTGEMNVANIYNPASYSSSATGAGQAAGTTANQIQQADAAASPMGMIGGLVGGAASAFLGGGAFANMTKN